MWGFNQQADQFNSTPAMRGGNRSPRIPLPVTNRGGGTGLPNYSNENVERLGFFSDLVPQMRQQYSGRDGYGNRSPMIPGPLTSTPPPMIGEHQAPDTNWEDYMNSPNREDRDTPVAQELIQNANNVVNREGSNIGDKIQSVGATVGNAIRDGAGAAKRGAGNLLQFIGESMMEGEAPYGYKWRNKLQDGRHMITPFLQQMAESEAKQFPQQNESLENARRLQQLRLTFNDLDKRYRAGNLHDDDLKAEQIYNITVDNLNTLAEQLGGMPFTKTEDPNNPELRARLMASTVPIRQDIELYNQLNDPLVPDAIKVQSLTAMMKRLATDVGNISDSERATYAYSMLSEDNKGRIRETTRNFINDMVRAAGQSTNSALTTAITNTIRRLQNSDYNPGVITAQTMDELKNRYGSESDYSLVVPAMDKAFQTWKNSLQTVNLTPDIPAMNNVLRRDIENKKETLLYNARALKYRRPERLLQGLDLVGDELNAGSSATGNEVMPMPRLNMAGLPIRIPATGNQEQTRSGL